MRFERCDPSSRVAKQLPEYRVTVLPALTKSGGDEVLRLSIDGRNVGMTLRISQFNKQLVEGLRHRALDLLEIAALVYCADASVSRGGPADQKMGEKWHRRFVVEMPVRDVTFWQSGDVIAPLEETLMFLSGDRFEFTFSHKSDEEAERSRFFKFGLDSAWRPDRVLMFSGGLDSFAGALEEIAEHKHQVALVSHYSASKIAPVQRRLQKALQDRFGPESCRHFPVKAQLTAGSTRESTHRTRSFLFATLGAITAQAFGLERVSFHENGIVSLNLPPVGNVIGTRATRTTHPQTLTRFTRLLALVFENGTHVDNPFFLRTKSDVVERIQQLGMGNQIVETRSCADTHNQTKQFFHCGRCSQCIDRRFAVLSEGLEHLDPADAYRVDLLQDPRTEGTDREMALSYVRNAQVLEHITPSRLENAFPDILDTLNHLGHPPATALSLVTDLLNRHGAAVTSVMRHALDSKKASGYPEQSLPRLYGELQTGVALPSMGIARSPPSIASPELMTVEIDREKRVVTINSRIEIKRNGAADLLLVLADDWLTAAGKGTEPLDFPCIQAGRLAEKLSATSGEAVRRKVSNARKSLLQKFQSAGLDSKFADGLIENIPWHGYRLAPDRVVVRVRSRA
jgi:7-cyano-7-deazaguanine synthase in queuosine biosynthesis